MSRRHTSIIIVPDEATGASRSFRVSHPALRLMAGAAIVAVVSMLGLLASWSYMAAKAARTDELEARLESMETGQAEVAALAAELESVAEQYESFRRLFGSGDMAPPSSLWSSSGRPADRPEPVETKEPTSWPLTERGFVTQSLLEAGQGEHPGLDIAVPTDTYVRAAGAGVVAEVGDDEVYGRYVVVDHENGYTSRYAHASQTLVEVGSPVLRNEVIALSGSTGRSTAPHLHFEIHQEGAPIDPLTMVSQP